MTVPTYDGLFNPVLQSLHELGGSSSVSEMEDKVAKLLKLSEKEVNEIDRGNRTKLSYRLTWARNYLKRYGLIENSSRGVWSLTQKGIDTKAVDANEVNRSVKSMDSRTGGSRISNVGVPNEGTTVWQDKLLDKLKLLAPVEFERLCQRLLREAGFIQVEVTGKSGDGGIDGRGIIRIGGFLSFRVIFQCKRYKGSISSQQIREFKGTMAGRADKGLYITTGTFTRDAKLEASRDGTPPVDLVDGEELVQKMKELGLAVKIKNEELVEVDYDWFKRI